jgi:hypothetical protein
MEWKHEPAHNSVGRFNLGWKIRCPSLASGRPCIFFIENDLGLFTTALHALRRTRDSDVDDKSIFCRGGRGRRIGETGGKGNGINALAPRDGNSLGTLRLVFIPLGEIEIALTFKLNSNTAESTVDLACGEEFDLLIINHQELSLGSCNTVARDGIGTPYFMLDPVAGGIRMGWGEVDPILAFSATYTVLLEFLDLLVGLQEFFPFGLGGTTSWSGFGGRRVLRRWRFGLLAFKRGLGGVGSRRDNQGWLQVTTSPMDLPRTDCIGLLATKVDSLVASGAFGGMSFQLAAFRLVLEILDAFAFVASSLGDTYRRIRDRYTVIEVVICSDGFSFGLGFADWS